MSCLKTKYFCVCCFVVLAFFRGRIFFFFFFFFFFIQFHIPFMNISAHMRYETGQSLGGARMRETENPPGSKAELGLSHMCPMWGSIPHQKQSQERQIKSRVSNYIACAASKVSRQNEILENDSGGVPFLRHTRCTTNVLCVVNVSFSSTQVGTCRFNLLIQCWKHS